MKNKLLSRDEFRDKVFERDEATCIIPGCGNFANEAHHIVERRLWSDGGYYLDNGASLCNKHHRQAESNTICPQYLRHILNIPNKLPEQFKDIFNTDKWGASFTLPREFDFKYPSTFYLPFSPTVAKEDHRNKCSNIKHLIGVPIVSTIKMDGSNSRFTNIKPTARNGHQATHESFDLMKSMFESRLKYLIPENLVIFGEWIYAKHSIEYKGDLALEGYFQCFSIFDRKRNIFLDWNETKEWCTKLELITVPVLDENKVFNTEWELIYYLSKLGEEVVKQGHEGIVVRSMYGYHFSQHKDFVLKYVRENHVQTNKMWSHQKVVKNEILKP